MAEGKAGPSRSFQLGRRACPLCRALRGEKASQRLWASLPAGLRFFPWGPRGQNRGARQGLPEEAGVDPTCAAAAVFPRLQQGLGPRG